MATKIETSPKYGTTIALGSETKYPFRFGPGKARLVLAHIEEIKAFVAKYGADGLPPYRSTLKNGRCEDAPCCGCCPP